MDLTRVLEPCYGVRSFRESFFTRTQAMCGIVYEQVNKSNRDFGTRTSILFKLALLSIMIRSFGER